MTERELTHEEKVAAYNAKMLASMENVMDRLQIAGVEVTEEERERFLSEDPDGDDDDT